MVQSLYYLEANLIEVSFKLITILYRVDCIIVLYKSDSVKMIL